MTTDSGTLYLWLLPLSWVVHDLEELLLRDRWKRRNGTRLDELANRSRNTARVVRIHSTSTREFGVAVLVVGALLFSVTAVATQNLDGNWTILYAIFLGGYFFHAFIHVGQSVLLRGYTPGVVTAVTVVMPASTILYSVLLQASVFDGRLVVLTALTGLLVFFPVVRGAHLLARLLE